MADAQRQAEGQGPRVAGGGAFDTGLRTGPAPVIGGSADYHQDLSFGPGVDLRQQRELMVQLAQSYDAMGRKIVLSNAGVAGREFPLSGTAQQQNEFILNAQSAHRNRPGGGRTAIDFYAPTKTDPKGRFGSSVVNQPMLAPTVAGGKTNYFAGGAGGAGVELTKDGQSILKLIHGRTDIPLPSGGSVAGAPGAAPTPALQSLDLDDLTPAAEAYAAAVRGVASAMERFRALQAALTEAQTVAAFEAIAKAAFPQVQLEGYEDNLFTVQETYDAVAASAAGAFDPERAAITIDRTMKIAAANREVKQITDEIEKRPNITEKERNKLADDLAAKQAKYLADLAKEEAAKLRILAVQRATDFITQTQADTKAIYDNIEVLELRNRLRFEGVDPAVIAGAEALLLNERRMVEATKLLNEQLAIEYAERDRLQKLKATADAAALPALQKDLDDALAKIAKLEGQRAGVQATGFAQAGAINAQTAAETEPGAKIRAFIGDARRELADLQAVAVRVSQSIGDAIGNSLANGITGLIEGTTTAKQVFADFLKSIGQMLVQEGTKMIAMYIAIAIAKAFAGMSGGGGNPVKPGGDWMSAVGRMSPNANGNAFGANGIMPFAKGGAFTNSIVSSPTLFKFANGGTTQMGEMGEAGPEAIMPLSRGRGGRLGVDASGLRSAMGRPPGGATTTPVLNMSFQSTTINGVEYVSRDQLEAAMAETRRQAAKEGASRGMDMTLDKIQNSPSTRSRVGIR
jgi:lambda family phage tail tape measure protein